MCGIAGWLGCVPEGRNCAARMAESLRHRGPDACGIKSWPGATLVHTRLSIIDLSVGGAQPMTNEDGTVWTVFNGEIYNHGELRRDLQSRGHILHGRSDAEVLPHLYEEHGSEFVAKLRGMFAVAIYDSRARTLVLVRDRFGIKPLFYAPKKDGLAFASEIRALLQLADIDTRPNRQAISDFAALSYIPAPETFYSGIRALEPGEILEAWLEGDQVFWKIRKYHVWTIAPNFQMTPAQAVDQAEALLANAVKKQLESDVPLGALLSGGIDSSLVSAAAQAAVGGRLRRLRTYNVRFSDEQYDETWAALAVAKHIGTHHETLNMDQVKGTWDNITGLLLHAGQPFADTSLFAVNAVCRLMRQHVTVALSGDGGDEGFGGYELYWQIAKIARLQRVPALILSAAATGLVPLSRLRLIRDSLPQTIRHLAGADDTAIVQSLLSGGMGEEEHTRFCRNDDLFPVRRFFEPRWQRELPPEASRLERLSAHTTEVNTRLVLPNDFLFKVDTASMKESLEIRVPMLDEELFAFGLSLPHRLKVNGRTCKRILRAVAERTLPPAVAHKAKWGFAVPVDTWVDVDFKACLREALSSRSDKLSEFFHPEAYRPILDAFCNGRGYHGLSRQALYQRVIMLLSIHLSVSQKRPSEHDLVADRSCYAMLTGGR